MAGPTRAPSPETATTALAAGAIPVSTLASPALLRERDRRRAERPWGSSIRRRTHGLRVTRRRSAPAAAIKESCSRPTRQILRREKAGGEERLDGSGQEGHCEGASASAVGPKSLMHSPHRIGNVNRMHRRPQVSRSHAVTRRARGPEIVTEAPHGASRLTEAGGREDIRSLPVPRGAAERRAHDGRPRGQTTSARTGAAAAGR